MDVIMEQWKKPSINVWLIFTIIQEAFFAIKLIYFLSYILLVDGIKGLSLEFGFQ